MREARLRLDGQSWQIISPLRRTMVPELVLQIIVPVPVRRFAPPISQKWPAEAETSPNSLSRNILQGTSLL